MSKCIVMYAADDGSLPVDSEEQARKMLARRREVEFGQYYEAVKHLTYETRFVEISEIQAEALRFYFRSADGVMTEPGMAKDIADLKAAIHAVLKHWNDDDSDGDDSSCAPVPGFFVRLSTRSPKDAIDKLPLRKRLLEVMRREIREAYSLYTATAAELSKSSSAAGSVELLKPTDSELLSVSQCWNELSANEKLIVCRRSFALAMAVKNAEQILGLLTFSSRCVSDIRRQLEYRRLLPEWSLQLVIRRFEHIPPQNEFRCFVYKRQLTAATQYFQHCFFPELAHHKMEYWQLIQQFFDEHIVDHSHETETVSGSCKCKNDGDTITTAKTEETKSDDSKQSGAIESAAAGDHLKCDCDYCGLAPPLIIADSCVMDLNVDFRTRNVRLIELNPFAITTGPGFFRWVDDADILKSDRRTSDIEAAERIRVREEDDHRLDAVLMQWNDVFDELDEDGDSRTPAAAASAHSKATSKKRECVVM